MSKLYTMKETAEMLRISERTLVRMIKAAQIEPCYIGGKNLFEETEIQKYIKRSKSRAS